MPHLIGWTFSPATLSDLDVLPGLTLLAGRSLQPPPINWEFSQLESLFSFHLQARPPSNPRVLSLTCPSREFPRPLTRPPLKVLRPFPSASVTAAVSCIVCQ